MAKPARREPRTKAGPAALKTYRAKRDFTLTSEPAGDSGPKRKRATAASFVIQSHAARRHHFDFRLELDGVLKSWAVPKGLSLDPADKRLAVRTEDHPLEYGGFEGTIPKGEYGAGPVMIWDRGTWEPVGNPNEGLAKGQLKFMLRGQRLVGGFALVRLKPRGREKSESWLIVKERDGYVDPATAPAERWTNSVVSGRSFEEIEAGTPPRDEAKKPKTSRHTRAAAPSVMPAFRVPELATLADKPPSGDHWLHEIKFDGYRAIAALAGGRCRLYTRSGLDWTDKFGRLPAALASLDAASALVDGEIVVLDEQGRSSFGLLQEALKQGGRDLVYYVFDLLELDGADCSVLPLVERKQRLAQLIEKAPASIRLSNHHSGAGEKLLREACRMGLEGIVSKRADKPYRSRRTLDWVKCKCAGRDEFVVVGWARSDKKERAFASLLLGEYADGRLVYRGRVGTGFDERTLADISARLERIAREKPTVSGLPRAVTRNARWVEPKLVAEVSYTERTRDGILRHPSFLGLREDKPARSVATPESIVSAPAERSAPRAAGLPAGFRLTHAGKVMFPEANITKADLAAYWQSVAHLALPHIAGRPLSLVRCPNGSGEACFFQRHHGRGMPKGMLALPLKESDGGKADYIEIGGIEGLLGAAQIGALELHIWGSRSAKVELPDRLVLDLDPDPSVGFAAVRAAATDMKAVLAAAGLTSYPMLTGGKGIHVVAPLRPDMDWEELKACARGIAVSLAEEDPSRFTAVMSKSRRRGRIFIDYLRNERGSTAIAPYSPRARGTAPVAVPVAWGELARMDSAAAYTIATLPRRVSSLRHDPWEGYFELRQTMKAATHRLLAAAAARK